MAGINSNLQYSYCTRCGKALKSLQSRANGMGPTCAAKAGRSDSGRLLDDQPVLVGVPPLLEAGLICRRLEDGRAACNVPQLVVDHSPSGFEWGYGGSGPADLALNVLHILLPPKGDHMDRVLGEIVVSNDAARLHQDFKRHFLENMKEDGGHVPLEEIQGWIAKQLVAEAA